MAHFSTKDKMLLISEICGQKSIDGLMQQKEKVKICYFQIPLNPLPAPTIPQPLSGLYPDRGNAL